MRDKHNRENIHRLYKHGSYLVFKPLRNISKAHVCMYIYAESIVEVSQICTETCAYVCKFRNFLSQTRIFYNETFSNTFKIRHKPLHVYHHIYKIPTTFTYKNTFLNLFKKNMYLCGLKIHHTAINWNEYVFYVFTFVKNCKNLQGINR